MVCSKLIKIGTVGLIPISLKMDFIEVKVNRHCTPKLIFIGDFGIREFRIVMESEFEMTDMGLMKFFLGIEFQQYESGIFILHSKYTSEFLKIFNMSNCKIAPTPVIIGLKLSKDDK